MAKEPRSVVRPHRFWVDPDIPEDFQGRRRCKRPGCGLMGKPGDQHHPSDFDLEDLPETPPEDESSRILGEGSDAA